MNVGGRHPGYRLCSTGVRGARQRVNNVFDLVHFAIVMTVNMEVALITPPVGLNLYVLTNVANSNLSEVTRGVFPFVFLSLLELLIITYWPAFSLWLPGILMPTP